MSRVRTEYNREYYRLNLEREQKRNRTNRLKRHYGLSLEEFDEMLAAQGGGCAICGISQPGGRWKQWHVDHDHAAEKIGLIVVRGLLCNNCNVLIGHSGDDSARLEKAADYLRKVR